MEKETIELVKKMIEDGNLSQEIAEKYCPELKESEDERIRKALIGGFTVMKESKNCGKTFSNHNIPVADILAWLEKQGGLMKALQISNARIGELIEENYYLKEQFEKQGKNDMGISEATKQKLEDNLNNALEKETPEFLNEFLDKQKPANVFNIYEKPLLEKFRQAVYDCAWGKVTCKTEGETQEEYAKRWAEQFLLMVRDWADDYIDFTIQQKLRKSYDKGKENAIKENRSSWGEEDKSYLLDFTRWFEQKAKAYDINLPMRGYDICAFCKEIIERFSCENLVWENIDETQRTNAIIMLKEGARRVYTQDSIDKCVDWLKSLRPQKPLTNEEIEQAKKEYRDVALSKVDYIPEELTYDDGWDDAISYMKKSLWPQTPLEA